MVLSFQLIYQFTSSVVSIYLHSHINICLFQESEKGSWHVPLAAEAIEESSRTWLCITRQASCESGNKQHASVVEASQVSELDQIAASCHSAGGLNGCAGLTGKRKERSPSPSPSHSSLQS